MCHNTGLDNGHNIPTKYSRLFTRDAFIKMFKYEV